MIFCRVSAKKLVTFLFSLLLFACATSSNDLSKSKENDDLFLLWPPQEVVEKVRKEDSWKIDPVRQAIISDPGERKVTYKEIWMPTYAETQEALLSAYAFILSVPQFPYEKGYDNSCENTYCREFYNFSAHNLLAIQEHWKGYYVQFLGTYFKGRKVIVCAFLLRKKIDAEYWKTTMFTVDDGGYSVWGVEIYMDTMKAMGGWVNGEA